MRHQSSTLGCLNWVTEKVGEIEAAVVQLEKVVMTLPHVASASAKREAEAAAIKDLINNTYLSSEVDWAELELACQNFTKTVRDYANIVGQVVTTGTEAGCEYWLSFLQPVLMSASDAIDVARNKIHTVTHRISEEIEKAETKPAEASTTDDQPSKGIKCDCE
jgi:hypothetical protein